MHEAQAAGRAARMRAPREKGSSAPNEAPRARW